MTPFACSHSSPFLPPSPTRPSPPPTTTAATPLSSSKTRRDASRRMLLATTALSTLLRPLPARSDDDFLEDEQRLVRIFQETTGSVVCIKNLEFVGDGIGGDGDEEEKNVNVEGTGSGFVWDNKGHIVTNYHVIANFAADRTGRQLCQVLLEDSSGKTFAENASLTGFDSENDLAVLKVNVNPERLKPAPIGTSIDLRVGQNCYAIGNPFGYEHTLTTGVLSGLGREIPSPNGQSIRGAIQTDASINSGNSGGPLVDSYGHVIGVNTATFTRKGSGLSSGVNFAIPIDTVVRLVPYLIVYGTCKSNRY